MKYYFICLLIFSIFSAKKTIGQDGKFTGYATALVTPDSIIQIKTVGFADKGKAIKYSSSTVQPVASVSKTFIGISLMIAKEKGLVDLDKDINEYLDFKISNPYFNGNNKITLRHLATHTSGIIDYEKVYRSAYCFGLKPSISLKNFLKDNLGEKGNRYSKRNFYESKSGKRYEYSNIGSALAAYIIERTSGKTFDEFTKEFIFIPLDMKNSGWFYEDINPHHLAILYNEKDRALKPYSCITYPDGSLKTTIEDLSIYLKELMRGYNKNSDLLSPESWAEFYEKNFSCALNIDNIDVKEPNTGIFIVYFKSGKIGHTGSDLGVSSFMMFDPQINVGQIFMANEDLIKENLQEFKNIWGELK